MKILFAISVFDIGGAEVLAFRLAQKLHERGHEIIFFASNEKVLNKQLAEKYSPYIKSRHSLAQWPKVQFIASRLNKLTRRLGFGDALIEKARGRFLRSVIKSENIDLVCSHSPRSDINCKEAVKNLNVPLVMIEHGIYSHYLFKKRKHLLKPLLSATEIVAVSDFCNKQMKSYIGAAAEVTTIYNGVEIEAPHSRAQVRKELGIGDGDIAFGFAARGRPKKGWQPAIDAFLKLKEERKEKTHLILVGGGHYVKELQEEYKNHKEIHFIGKVSNPAYYIDAVDVGLMLSTYQTEALSLIAIEFLMLGKPVIATNVGGVPEVFQTCDDSMYQLIDLKEDGSVDTGKLKDVMLSFTRQEKSLALDKAQVEPVLRKFSMDTCVQAYESLFQRMVHDKKQDPSQLIQVKNKSSVLKEEKVKQVEVLDEHV